MQNPIITNNIFVGRQPIYNRDQQVVAYELLYRAGEDNCAVIDDGDRATTEVIINSVLDIGLEAIVGKYTAFFNLTQSFIRGDHPLPLDSKQVVLELLEDIEPDEEILRGLQQLIAENYTIALDDFEYSDKLIPLLRLAHIVKLEVTNRSREQLQQAIAQLRPYKVKLLAEKVETHEEYALCRELGFDYFQGYFFCKPNIVRGSSPPANRLVVLKLLARLQDPETRLEALEHLIVQDVSLTYRLLRYINSAAFALNRKIESIHQALLLIGITTIRNWVSLLLLSRIDDKPVELMRTALIRARMCELLSERHGHRNGHDHYFTCGLLSVLDAFMDRPMEELLAQLPLSEELKQAILEQRGDAGAVLAETLAYERGEWHRLAGRQIPASDYRDCYLQAVGWANESMASLQEG